MPPEFNTLEDARAEIVRLNEELTRERTEKESYSTKLSDTETELENVRKLNQQYFNKLSSYYTDDDSEKDDEDEDDTPTCEEFAKTLTI